jgi:putative transposase
MSYNPEIHHRRSIRLKDYDYSSGGAYFITICVKNRECLFGEIIEGKMNLSEIGEIAHNNWLNIPEHFNNVILDEFVVMPNHIHGILILNPAEEDVKYYAPEIIGHQPVNDIPNQDNGRDVLINVPIINDSQKNKYFQRIMLS